MTSERSETKVRKMDTNSINNATLESAGLPEPTTLLKVHDISQKTGLPPHVQYLMTLKGDDDFISIHEWAARLCHVLLVETGYFPVIDGADELSVMEVLEMPDNVRIPHFAKQLSPHCIFSDKGIYTLKYRVILSELEEISPESETYSGEKEKASMDTSTADSSTPSSEGHPADNQPEGPNQQDKMKMEKWTYRFSNVVNVTMLIMEDRLIVSASYNPGIKGSRTLNHQIIINIEEFMKVRVRMVPVRLRPEQWLRRFDLNSIRFAGFFKNKFAMHFLDQIDGLVFERRGLICLPQLALMKILKMSHVKTILSMGRSCVYLYHITKDNALWKFLLKRDFPNDHINTIFVSAPAPVPSTDSSQYYSEPDKDFYEMYKQKYMAKHRIVHRLNSVPARLHPIIPIGRRNPSQPFPLNPFFPNPFFRF